MGFTRYHYIDTQHSEFKDGWHTLVDDARRIVQAVEDQGIRLCGGTGTGPVVITSAPAVAEDPNMGPQVFPSGAIWFNGDDEREEGCETFVLRPEMNDKRENWFTKTERLPYDLAVAAVLLRAKAVAPGAVRISADADADWQEATALLDGLGLAAGRPGA